MKHLLPVLLACGIAMCGCRRKPAPPTAPIPEVPPPAAVEKSPAPVAPAPVQAGTTTPTAGKYLPGTTAFDDLSRHLVWFVASKNRFPVDVNELLSANRLPQPVLPPGGQLAINKKTKTVDYVGPK